MTFQTSEASTAHGGPRSRPESDLRSLLRASTAASHARIDARFGVFDLTSMKGYRGFLEANASALIPLEQALERAGIEKLFPDWQQRRRSGAILRDLALVGGTNRPLPAPELPGQGEMIGAMYVLEGSRLGAKVLLKSVMLSGDPRVASATNYLRHGEGRPLWPTFLPLLESHGGTLADNESVVRGAHLGFGLFERAASFSPAAVLA